jgi:hypothetical protein
LITQEVAAADMRGTQVSAHHSRAALAERVAVVAVQEMDLDL